MSVFHDVTVKVCMVSVIDLVAVPTLVHFDRTVPVGACGRSSAG
jgi:hypothetical protein